MTDVLDIPLLHRQYASMTAKSSSGISKRTSDFPLANVSPFGWRCQPVWLVVMRGALLLFTRSARATSDRQFSDDVSIKVPARRRLMVD